MSGSSSTYSKNFLSIIFIAGLLFIIIIGISVKLIEISNETPSSPNIQQLVSAQEVNKSDDSSNKIYQNKSIIVHAVGHFANNQIKDGIVTWIQGGLWDLLIKNATVNNNSDIFHNNNTFKKPNITAVFNANFTMIKPDGSLSHSHKINNFTSTNVIFAGNDIIITGIANIHSNVGLEFNQVPITVHLMGKRVLGLMINVEKTNGHFASSNEMFGTLISGIGLKEPAIDSTAIRNLDSNKTGISH
ncbi:MAG: hypothetical protein ACTHJ2_02225 [Candidatus Nitrosocosmicus sp.]